MSRTGPKSPEHRAAIGRGTRAAKLREVQERIKAQGGMKCYMCKEIKPVTMFEKDSAKLIGHTTRCKDCSRKRALAYRNKNIERARRNSARWQSENKGRERNNHRRRFLKKLGIEVSGNHEWEGLCCSICGQEDDPTDRNKAIVVDHCHFSDTFRGWLCQSCNRGLGCFHDHPGKLSAAIAYLENHFELLALEYEERLEETEAA